MRLRRPALPVTLATLAALALAGCGLGSDEGSEAASGRASGPGAVSEGEARALEEAARLLDEQRLPEGALTPGDPSANDSAATPAPAPPAAQSTPQQDNPQ